MSSWFLRPTFRPQTNRLPLPFLPPPFFPFFLFFLHCYCYPVHHHLPSPIDFLYSSNLCPPVCFCPMTSRGKQMGRERMRGEKRFEITAGRKNLVNAREDARQRRRVGWRWNLEEEKRGKWKDNAEPALFVPLPWLDIGQVCERNSNYKFYPLIRPSARNNTKSSYV